MNPAQRDRLAIPVVLVYWLLLLGGLAACAAIRIEDYASIMSVWVGAVAGTLVGQSLAMRDYRPWIAVLVIIIATGIGAQLVPIDLGGRELWLAFVPAALCGFWSLGDRSVLAACWFPVVLWMLAILDRSSGTLADGASIVLLAPLAVLFIALLRVRESRRVGLWRSIATVPLAPARPVELLRTPPHSQLARAGWGLSVSSITIAITGWVAPALWRIEEVDGRARQAIASPHRLPCCPGRTVMSEASRVKEYLDLGRGHDERVARPLAGCRVCYEITSAPARGHRRRGATASAWDRAVVTGEAPVAVDPGWPALAERMDELERRLAYERSRLERLSQEREPAPAVAWQPAPPPAQVVEPAPAAPAGSRPIAESPVSVEPPPIEPAPVEPAPVESASVEAAAPVELARPAARPSDDASSAAAAPAEPLGPSLVRWLLLLATAALIAQLVTLALRPLRRLLTLRHLRRPFWDETIAQRVSNAWQLALVGLRDAGWRTGHAEAPHELARRTGVDGLEQCATILERARHGIGIDPEDLTQMHASADTAYRAARQGAGRLSRALAWLRWPLTDR
jgi:hypothetical protein